MMHSPDKTCLSCARCHLSPELLSREHEEHARRGLWASHVDDRPREERLVASLAENDLGSNSSKTKTPPPGIYAMRNLHWACWLFWVGLPMLAAYPVPTSLVTGTLFFFFRFREFSQFREVDVKYHSGLDCFSISLNTLYICIHIHMLFCRQEGSTFLLLIFLFSRKRWRINWNALEWY